MLPVVIRPLASAQLDDAVDYYKLVASDAVANRFVDAFQAACSLIAQQPDIGSLRHRHLHPGGNLRSWRLDRFPYQQFYSVEADGVHVIALMHQRRDVKPLAP